MELSLKEAAQLLGTTARTLRGWLLEEGIEPAASETDRRAHKISVEELRAVTAKHHRPLIFFPQDPLEEITLGSLAKRVEFLEQNLQYLQMQGKTEQARGSLAERVLRSAHSDSPTRLVQAISGLSVKDVQIVVQAAIDLINSAPPLSPDQNKEIIVTFQGELDILDIVPLLRNEWRRALERAMLRGWHIAHLIRPTEDLVRAMSVAEDLMQLLRGPRGAYVPMFMPLSSEAGPQLQEFVAVPDIGILELRSSTGSHIDIVARHSPGKKLDNLYASLLRIKEDSTPIVTLFPSLSVKFNHAIREAEDANGDRYLVMNGLSELTVPFAIHEERAETILGQTADPETRRMMQDLLTIRAEREAVFERQVQRWRYRDVCPIGAIRRYVQTGIYSPDDTFGALGAPPLSRLQIAAHLSNLILRLETYPNYELGLVDENIHDASIYQTFWMVKGRHVVLLECQSLTAQGKEEEIDLAIYEARIIDAFYEHFFRLWAQLLPTNRDKQHVISWLKAQLAEIPQHD